MTSKTLSIPAGFVQIPQENQVGHGADVLINAPEGDNRAEKLEYHTDGLATHIPPDRERSTSATEVLVAPGVFNRLSALGHAAVNSALNLVGLGSGLPFVLEMTPATQRKTDWLLQAVEQATTPEKKLDTTKELVRLISQQSSKIRNSPEVGAEDVALAFHNLRYAINYYEASNAEWLATIRHVEIENAISTFAKAPDVSQQRSSVLIQVMKTMSDRVEMTNAAMGMVKTLANQSRSARGFGARLTSDDVLQGIQNAKTLLRSNDLTTAPWTRTFDALDAKNLSLWSA